MSVFAKERKKRVIKRLEKQLTSGVKPIKNASQKNAFGEFRGEVDLTETDIKRIQKELQTLKERV